MAAAAVTLDLRNMRRSGSCDIRVSVFDGQFFAIIQMPGVNVESVALSGHGVSEIEVTQNGNPQRERGARAKLLDSLADASGYDVITA